MKSAKIMQCVVALFCAAQFSQSGAATSKEVTKETAKAVEVKGAEGEVKQFLSANFGSLEAAVKKAIMEDFDAKESDIRSSVDTRSGMRVLEVSSRSFRPLDTPATVRYLFGFKCKCLNQVNVDWKLAEQATADQKEVYLMAIKALVDHLDNKEWLTDQVVKDRAIGDVKLGAKLPYVFFRGVNSRNTAVVLSAEPVAIKGDNSSAGKFSADFDQMRSVQLAYQLDSKNPDVRKFRLEGF